MPKSEDKLLSKRQKNHRNNFIQIYVENDDEFIGLTRKENIENEKREKNGLVKITPVGCGKQLSWDEMEDCYNEVIEKLKEIAVDDYYSGLMKVSNKINKE